MCCLQLYDKTYNVPEETTVDVIGPNDPASCAVNANNCVEAELDIQIITAIAQLGNTTFWSIPGDESFLQVCLCLCLGLGLGLGLCLCLMLMVMQGIGVVLTVRPALGAALDRPLVCRTATVDCDSGSTRLRPTRRRRSCTPSRTARTRRRRTRRRTSGSTLRSLRWAGVAGDNARNGKSFCGTSLLLSRGGRC